MKQDLSFYELKKTLYKLKIRQNLSRSMSRFKVTRTNQASCWRMAQCRHPGGVDMCWRGIAAMCCPVASSTKRPLPCTPSDVLGSPPACVHQTFSGSHQYVHGITAANTDPLMLLVLSVFRSHRLPTVHRCRLLLQMSHVAWSVCLCVCWTMNIQASCTKTAEPIEMMFRGLDGGQDPPWEGALLRGEMYRSL